MIQVAAQVRVHYLCVPLIDQPMHFIDCIEGTLVRPIGVLLRRQIW
jgi:hypothetical protein